MRHFRSGPSCSRRQILKCGSDDIAVLLHLGLKSPKTTALRSHASAPHKFLVRADPYRSLFERNPVQNQAHSDRSKMPRTPIFLQASENNVSVIGADVGTARQQIFVHCRRNDLAPKYLQDYLLVLLILGLRPSMCPFSVLSHACSTYFGFEIFPCAFSPFSLTSPAVPRSSPETASSYAARRRFGL